MAKAEAEAKAAAEALRAKPLKQFNQVLETRDTDLGLVVNMSDVLFDSDKYTFHRKQVKSLPVLQGSC